MRICSTLFTCQVSKQSLVLFHTDNRISGEVKWDCNAVEELVIEGPTVGQRFMDMVSISGPRLIEKILFGETSAWCIGYTREICEVRATLLGVVSSRPKNDL